MGKKKKYPKDSPAHIFPTSPGQTFSKEEEAKLKQIAKHIHGYLNRDFDLENDRWIVGFALCFFMVDRETGKTGKTDSVGNVPMELMGYQMAQCSVEIMKAVMTTMEKSGDRSH